MVAALCLGFGCACFASDAITAVRDADGRRIYVNDASPAKARSSSAIPAGSSQNFSANTATVRLMYWSNTQHRWKPVPRAAARAARSAAAEVLSQTASSETSASSSAQPTDSESSGTSPAATTLMSSEKVNTAIEAAASRHNVDPNLVRAVIKVESNFNPRAVSRKGAMGLMQLMPDTARQLNVAHPFDANENVDAGVRHLRSLLDSFGGDVRLSLAAYNAGAKAVQRSNGIPANPETRNYVKQITALYGSGYNVLGGPSHAPIRVGRDAEGHFIFSNTE
jgi:soluble lytic murein transglycosylase-like protein